MPKNTEFGGRGYKESSNENRDSFSNGRSPIFVLLVFAGRKWGRQEGVRCRARKEVILIPDKMLSNSEGSQLLLRENFGHEFGTIN
jgi:hypothetical protein